LPSLLVEGSSRYLVLAAGKRIFRRRNKIRDPP
jgi:hypothetical protein